MLLSPLLGAIKACGELSQARQLRDRVLGGSDFKHSVYMLNHVVQMLGKCGGVDEAATVFDFMAQRNEFSWSVLMAAYDHGGDVTAAERIFKAMPQRDLVTWNTMLSAFAHLGDLDKVGRIFDEMPQRGLNTWTVFLTAQASLGSRPDGAFARMPSHNVVAWNAILTGLVRRGQTFQAKELFDRLPERSFISWNALLPGYAQKGQVQEARRILELMPAATLVSWTLMIQTYAQDGDLEHAKLTFDSMPERSIVTWSTMFQALLDAGTTAMAMVVLQKMPEVNAIALTGLMAAYADQGDIRGAKSTFDAMPSRDIATWNCLLSACAKARLLAFDRSGGGGGGDDDDGGGGRLSPTTVFNRMPQRDIVSWSAALRAHAQCGQVIEGCLLFDEMPARNAVSWAAMLAGCAAFGFGKEAIELSRAMELEGETRDGVAFTSVLLACSHHGLVEEARSCFFSLVADGGMEPSVEHYCCMINTLGRAGKLVEAEELANSMPFEPDVTTWGTLLDACRGDRDLRCAGRAAGSLLLLDRADAGPYTLLPSIRVLARSN